MGVGGAPETEAAHREAIAAGDTDVWNNLGNVLSAQPGREAEAEATYRRPEEVHH